MAIALRVGDLGVSMCYFSSFTKIIKDQSVAITLMVRDLDDCVRTYFTKKKRKYIKVGHFPPFVLDCFFF